MPDEAVLTVHGRIPGNEALHERHAGGLLQKMGKPVGEQRAPTVSKRRHGEVEQFGINGSAHEIEMLQTLQMMDLCGDLPRVKILAVVPKRIEAASFELSDEAVKSAEIMEKTALEYLEGLGFKFERIASFSVRDAADEFDKKGRNDRSF